MVVGIYVEIYFNDFLFKGEFFNGRFLVWYFYIYFIVGIYNNYFVGFCLGYCEILVGSVVLYNLWKLVVSVIYVSCYFIIINDFV